MGVAVHGPSLVFVAWGAVFQSKTLPKVDVFHPRVDAAVANVEKYDDMSECWCCCWWWVGVGGHLIASDFQLMHLPKCYLNYIIKGAFVIICKIHKVTFNSILTNQLEAEIKITHLTTIMPLHRFANIIVSSAGIVTAQVRDWIYQMNYLSAPYLS